MHRIDTANKATDLFGAGKHGFKNGNKAEGIDATDLDADYFNDGQENLCRFIESQGIALVKGDYTQLTSAVTKAIQSGQRAVIIDGAVFNAGVTDGKAVYWDAANNRFDKALADGSAKQNVVGISDVTNSKVYAFGDCALLSGLTPGARYYLDGATAGVITSVPPTNAVFIGIAKGAAELFLDIDAEQSLGFGQSWGVVTRTNGTTYYNTTGKPIVLAGSMSTTALSSYSVSINGGATLPFCSAPASSSSVGSIIIPAGASYTLTISGAFSSGGFWELR